MGIFDFFKRGNEERAAEVDDSALITQLIGKETISREEALNIPAVSGCVEYIAGTIAALPIKLYREQDGNTEEVIGDDRVRLLNDDTGDLLTPYQAKKAQIRDYLISGGGYLYINRRRNKVKSLHYVDRRCVSTLKNTDPIFKTASIQVMGNTYRDFEFIKLLRNTDDGVTGKGIIEENPIILSVAYAAMTYELRLVKRGGNKKGFLQSQKKLSPEAITAIREAWNNLYSNNQNNMMVLNDGVEFKESSSTSVEMQLNEQKRTNDEEICTIFNLSTRVISGQASADEQAAAVKSAILPIIADYETTINKDLLLESEKKDHYFAFDTSELLKGDILKRYQAYRIGLLSNFIQPDEVRYKEDMPPLGLDFIKLGLNDVLYNPKTHEVYTPNTNQTVKILNPEEKGDTISEERFSGQNRNSKGQFWFGKEKTKYAPSPRRNTAGITVGKKKYGKLCGTFHTTFPTAKVGERKTIYDSKYQYRVSKDEYGSIIIHAKYRIDKK